MKSAHTQPSRAENKKPAAYEDSYILTVLVIAFKVVFKTVELVWLLLSAVVNGLGLGFTKSKPASAMPSPVRMPVVPDRHQGAHAAAPFPDTVFVGEPLEERFQIASRVHVVNLEIEPKVVVGRVFLYLYDRGTPYVRRLLRVDSPELRSIIGRDRYYMDDVPWDPKLGEPGLQVIKANAAADVERIVKERMVKRKKPSKAEAKPEAVSDKAPAPPAVIKFSAQPSAIEQAVQKPVAPVDLQSKVDRPMRGVPQVGVIAQMGRSQRPDGKGGSYNAFCVKLERDGIHYPFYGVELERELIEQQAKAGDQVSITYMGRQPMEKRDGEAERWKNLYSVKVLQKAAK